jgi:sacsin
MTGKFGRGFNSVGVPSKWMGKNQFML